MNHNQAQTMTVRCSLRTQDGEQFDAGERLLSFTFGRSEVLAVG